jgi:hypothetical protein
MAEIVDPWSRYRVLLHRYSLFAIRYSRAAFAMEMSRNAGSEITPGAAFERNKRPRRLTDYYSNPVYLRIFLVGNAS